MDTLRESIIHKDKHFTVKHDANVGLFLANWNHNSPLFMETFKEQLLIMKDLIIQHKPSSVIWLQEGFTTEVTLDTHIWVEENVNKVCVSIGLKKVAFVVGKDVMAHLNVFNFFEDMETSIQPKHFAGLQEALNWVLEKEKFAPLDADDIQINFLGKTNEGKSHFSIETSTQNTEATLKSFKYIIRENTFLKDHAEKFYSLTQREKEVFELHANGIGFKEIAEKLFLSEFTVRTHWRNTKKKLAIKSLMDISNYKNCFLS